MKKLVTLRKDDFKVPVFYTELLEFLEIPYAEEVDIWMHGS
jgi:hypothetical protein